MIKGHSRWARAFIILTVDVALLFVVAASVLADDTQTELVPEVNVFVRLSDTTRLFLLANLTRNLTEDTTDGAVGVHLDMTLKPIFRRQLHEADWERDKYLWVRIGYQYSENLVGEEGSSNENRGVLEATGRVPLPFEFWLVNRVHVDLRFIDGDYSQRYRERLGIEREVVVGGVTAVPYAEAEFYYDTRYYAWNRQVYQAGAEVGLTEHWRIESYYARQNDQRSSPAHINRIGLILKTYW
jgi:hypothetical protein